jgi:diacylglycerol O-acyltransferase
MAELSNAGNKRRLSLLDASFLYGESTVSPTHVGSIFLLEGELPFERVMNHMRQRLRISPRFRQRLAFPPFNLAHPTIEDDPDFKLEHHVQRRQLTPGLDEAGAVNEIVKFHFGRVMDRSRPLWDMTLFEGLPGRSLLVWAMHHALVDGVSAFEMLNRLMDFTPNPPPETEAERWTPTGFPSVQESLVRAARDLAVEQVDRTFGAARALMRDPSSLLKQAQTFMEAARLMSEMAQPLAPTPWNAGPAIGERNLVYLRMFFADYRAIRAAFGGTINDIVLAVLGEGAARYLAHHGWPTQGQLRFGCPVNVRRPEERISLENRVSMMMPARPAAPMDVLERLRAITAETRRIKESGAPYIMERLTGLNDSVPPSMQAALGAASAFGMQLVASMLRALNWKPTANGLRLPPPGISFVATNVPGPQTAWYFAGYKVANMIGLLPLGGNLGYGVAITSYDKHIIFSMIADDRLMPDVELMKNFVAAAFNELKERLPQDVRQTLVQAAENAQAA